VGEGSIDRGGQFVKGIEEEVSQNVLKLLTAHFDRVEFR
jgi:hypothetical protein